MSTTSDADAHADAQPRTSRTGPVLAWAKDQYPLYILLVLLVVAALSTDVFFTARNLTNLVVQVSVIGIVTLAQFIIVVSAGIDISVGSVVGLAGICSALVLGGDSVVLAILIACAVGLVTGALTGYLVSYRGLEAFIVTLGMLALARGLVYAFTEGTPVTPGAEDFRAIATTTIAGIPLIALLWIGLAVLVAFVMRRTTFGRRVFAIGSSKDAARAAGIPVERTLLLVYAVAGVMVGFAGFLLTSRVGAATPTAGNLYELDAIAAVVIGGTSLAGGEGTMLGTALGSLLLAMITVGIAITSVLSLYQLVFVGGITIIAVAIDRWTSGRAAAEPA